MRSTGMIAVFMLGTLGPAIQSDNLKTHRLEIAGQDGGIIASVGQAGKADIDPIDEPYRSVIRADKLIVKEIEFPSKYGRVGPVKVYTLGGDLFIKIPGNNHEQLYYLTSCGLTLWHEQQGRKYPTRITFWTSGDPCIEMERDHLEPREKGSLQFDMHRQNCKLTFDELFKWVEQKSDKDQSKRQD